MKVYSIFLFGFLLSTSAFANRNILLTGYWSPTNEMLREFSPDPKLNGGTWKGKNWRNSGYDIYAYFPQFTDAKDEVGQGNFPVDFASTYNDFQRITQELKPAFILSFGKGEGPWELETKFPAHYQKMFVSENLPSVIGSKVRYAVPDSLKTDATFPARLPFATIVGSVNRAERPHLPARIDERHDAGTFLCGFIGYLGGWYYEQHKNAPPAQQIFGNGFIHVNGDLPEAKVSLEKTLEAILPTLPPQNRR
jgi:pyrrolidone-carboxylate peptidase